MEKPARHRPLRQFPDAPRLIIPCDRETCLHCGQPLLHRKTWYVKKYVQTLDGPVFVAGKSRRCGNPDCPHPGATFYASAVLTISLPYSTYGLDVLAFIGWQHEHNHRQLVEIQRDLVQRGLLINERTVGKLYRQFLALLGGMTEQHQQRLQAAAQSHGGLIWAIDALQPEGSDPPLYVLYEVLSNTPVSALQESNPTTERLRAWLEPFTHLTFPVLATLSDGEKALVAALKASWQSAPHQRCQLHFLNNIAKAALEVDGRLRQHLRQELGDLAAVPQASPGALSAPASDDHTPLCVCKARCWLDRD
jgi:Transposase, Mutator family